MSSGMDRSLRKDATQAPVMLSYSYLRQTDKICQEFAVVEHLLGADTGIEL
jgi:hypothetical protein